MTGDLAIVAAEAFHLAIPSVYGGPQPKSGAQWPFVNLVLVRIETRGGLVGWGEAFGHNAAATSAAAFETLVAPLARDADGSDITGLGRRLRRALFTYGLDGPVGFALSGLDIALWDIRGKAEGKPLHRLLNPASAASAVPAYASLLRYGDAAMAGEAAGHAVARGHSAVKLHEADVASVAAARDAIGQRPLTLDVNCRWSIDEAIDTAKALKPFDLDWIEEPCWPPTAENLARIGAESGVSMAAGENAGSLEGLERIATVGKAAYIQPSAAKLGGLSGLIAASEVAARHGARLATHSAYFGPALAATVHFCAGSDLDCEWYDCRLEAWPAGLSPANGLLSLPRGNGLGIEIDGNLLRAYRVT